MPVNSVEDLLDDPQSEAAGLCVDVPTTLGGADGPDRSLAAPANFGSATDTALAATPAIGADTEDVLRGLGLDDQELARLRKDGIVTGRVGAA